MESIRIASAIDTLSLRLAARVESLLASRPDPGRAIGVLIDAPAKGASRAEEVAEAIRRGQADAGVLAASLLPAVLPAGIAVAATIRDTDEEYRWISRGASSLSSVPPGSKVVTADAVARAQIRNLYPTLRVETSGSIDAICEGLRQGTWAGACVAPELIECGHPWGLQSASISMAELLPPAGQGVVAVIALHGAEPTRFRLAAIDDAEARFRLRVERAFLRRVLAVPDTLATAIAIRQGSRVRVTGMIAETGGAWLAIDEAEGPAGFGGILAREIADSCVEIALSRRGAPSPMKAAAAF